MGMPQAFAWGEGIVDRTCIGDCLVVLLLSISSLAGPAKLGGEGADDEDNGDTATRRDDR